MPTRLLYQVSTSTWLNRIDHGEPLGSAEDARRGASDAFGIPLSDVGLVETEALTQRQRGSLPRAAGWTGTPPRELPSRSTTRGGRLDPKLVLPDSQTVRKTRIRALQDKAAKTSEEQAEILELVAEDYVP